MPPATKRRRTSSQQTPSKSNQQSTLSFRSTKAGLRQPSTKADIPKKALEIEDVERNGSPVHEDSDHHDTTEVTPEADEVNAVDECEEDEEDVDQAALDETALFLPETKLKGYWARKEAERKAPRIHQEGLGVHEKILREFDMSSRFGPSVGIQRLARWRRAQGLQLDPPIEVLAVLLKQDTTPEPASAGDRKDVQVSIIDDLTLSSRLKAEGLVET